MKLRGEGLDFLECDTCSATGNIITNGFSMNIYIDASRNIVIERNILRVNTDTYNTKWGRACGIGMASESGGIVISNILIKNNVIIGTRMGIYFFSIGTGGGYDKIKILHNTLWNVSVTPIWFRTPNNIPTECEMKNNFIYHTGEIEFSPKSSWSLAHNFYYNTYNLPEIYSDSTSKFAQTLNIKIMFNNIGNCNYLDENISAECFHPSEHINKSEQYLEHSSTPEHPGIMNMETLQIRGTPRHPGMINMKTLQFRGTPRHSGKIETILLVDAGTQTSVTTDFLGCERNTKTPTIGAF